MANWGVAYAIGPNYNFEWWMIDPATKANALGTAFDSNRAALTLVDRVTQPERVLIEALVARYPPPLCPPDGDVANPGIGALGRQPVARVVARRRPSDLWTLKSVVCKKPQLDIAKRADRN